ncbi:histidine-rich carboxyl terminus protein 1 [Meriones unguiculatus]|uniref:histidine-rich carboxyl terminus protein 1 n=1 Tax=Meriones unguiculatus TaxID=10047 RepID=UPI000B4EE972|nr:histidine-rich carboxyl terminus protein 1 [Meriones unguiculatus]XP_060234642.1 histidine-rich carboxyl terminus protein 1 [Meriones unguiculatus]
MLGLPGNSTFVIWIIGTVLAFLMLLLLLAICLFHRSQERDVERNRVRQAQPRLLHGRHLALLGVVRHHHYRGRVSGLTSAGFRHHHQHHQHHQHRHHPHHHHHHNHRQGAPTEW